MTSMKDIETYKIMQKEQREYGDNYFPILFDKILYHIFLYMIQLNKWFDEIMRT